MIPPVSAVFFDVDFTLIYPGPTFQAEGYERFCARYGIQVNPTLFDDAVRDSSVVFAEEQEHVYDEELFIRFTRRVIEEMGGRGDRLDACAREIYHEWASCQHFFLYDDVAPTLRALSTRGLKLGLISNSHRCLTSFQQHFELQELIVAAVSSAEHGYMKPHPSIFEAALEQVGASAAESMMVGDSLMHDIEGALRIGMRGVLVHRSSDPPPRAPGVPVIRRLEELIELL